MIYKQHRIAIFISNLDQCADGYWATGIACKGDFCDDVSLQCSHLPNLNPINCIWTGQISEENGGTLHFVNGYYARDAACFGSNCDNMSFFVCQF